MKAVVTATVASCIAVFIAVMISTASYAAAPQCDKGMTYDEETKKCVKD